MRKREDTEEGGRERAREGGGGGGERRGEMGTQPTKFPGLRQGGVGGGG